MKKILNIWIGLLTVVLLITIVHIGKSLKEYQDDQTVYRDIKENVIVENDDPVERQVDFSIIGSDTGTASWIYIPETNIDYPLAHGQDNEIFLTRDIYGKKSKAGAIFINCDNDARLTDPKSIIFGHNMKDGSMFHDLGNYKKESFAENHKKMYIYHSDDTISEYQIIGTLSTVWNNPLYTVSTKDTVENTLNYFEREADVFYGRLGEGNIVILSTCIKDERRYVCAFQKINTIESVSEPSE